MCGINGFNFYDKKLIKGMNLALSHRGPDSEGTYYDKNVTLGHRRLSIIDLSEKGAQPMSYSYKKRKAHIVFNGEIYNFMEIRDELKNKGYLFKSNSDTEVILAAYLEWGEKCVEKFNGMWAFSIYDPQEKILFLSRDRLGQKPLYYFFDGNRFIFSSEIKGILEYRSKLKLDNDAVDLYFSLGFIPAPYTIYEGVQKLKASENMVFDIKRKKIKKYLYYFPPKYSPTYDKKYLMEECKKLIKDSVRMRLVSDVPVGAFLSGGLDSSTIVYFMTKYKKRVKTYSLGIKGGDDETKYIKIMVNRLNLENEYYEFTKKDYKKLFDRIYYYYDEPFADYSIFPTFFISNLAKKDLTVVLTGDGGDEMFGGYRPHKNLAQMKILKKIPPPLRRVMSTLLKNSHHKKIKNLIEGIRLSFLDPESIFSDAKYDFYKPKIYKKLLRKEMSKAIEYANGDLVEAGIVYDRHFKTLGDNFICKVDRASMGNSIEARSPFLDYRFIELSSRIPSKWKANIFSTKILLRDIDREFLPKEITSPRKAGFSPPLERWTDSEENDLKIRNGTMNLYNKKILSKEWEKFYTKKVLSGDKLYNRYKTRMILFLKWFETWEKHIKYRTK